MFIDVIHFDCLEYSSRCHAPDEREPTVLSPLSTWLQGRYRPCGDTAALLQALAADEVGSGILLLHLTDVERCLEQTQTQRIVEWLHQGTEDGSVNRQLILYSGRWLSWGECLNTENLTKCRQLLPLLPEHYEHDWHLWPWPFISSEEARPLAWLGLKNRFYLTLSTMTGGLPKWRSQALGDLGLRETTEETTFREQLCAEHFIHHGLLVEWLDIEGNRPRTPGERRQQLLAWADRFWLLEGIALAHGWDTLAEGLQRCWQALVPLVELRSSISLSSPEGRPQWTEAVETIEDQLAEWRS